MFQLSASISVTILLRGERDVRRADPNARLYSKTWSQKGKSQTMANRYNTGKAKNIPRASVGLQSANNIQRT